MKTELDNFSFNYPVHFITGNKNHDICFSYFPEDKQWAYFGIREKIALITQDNELVTHIWNNMDPDTRADIGMEVYLAKADLQLFQQCSQKLKSIKDWTVLQTISNSSINLAAIGSKFSDTDNVRRAVSYHNFFYNNKIPISGFIIFSLVMMAVTDLSNFDKTGSIIIFALLMATVNCQSDSRLK